MNRHKQFLLHRQGLFTTIVANLAPLLLDLQTFRPTSNKSSKFIDKPLLLSVEASPVVFCEREVVFSLRRPNSLCRRLLRGHDELVTFSLSDRLTSKQLKSKHSRFL